MFGRVDSRHLCAQTGPAPGSFDQSPYSTSVILGAQDGGNNPTAFVTSFDCENKLAHIDYAAEAILAN